MTGITLTVNGRTITADVEPRQHLADFLRENLLLTGTHLGCEHGVCGACTVLLNDEPVRSCITYAALCDGATVQSIEGLDDDTTAIALRTAFSAEHALQCGYCTPGMLVTARDIVRRLPGANDERIRVELAGNLCRCTGYNGIVKAIRRVLDAGVAEPVLPTPAAVPGGLFDLTVDSIPNLQSYANTDDRMQKTNDLPGISPSNDHRVAYNGMQTHESTAKSNSASPPTATLTQTLRLNLPSDTVWAAIQDPSLVATCIPGARLTAIDGDHIEGEMLASLGPIRARFTGQATLAFDQNTQRGRITGEGRDNRGGSRLSSEASFILAPDGPEATLIRLELRYALRGALAQVGRGPVVQVFVDEILATVARNLEARLSGGTPPEPPSQLGLGQILVRIVWQTLRRWLPQSKV